jgi:hypothetical protein
VALAATLAACRTDVSGPTSFGTQGSVVTGIGAGLHVQALAAGQQGVYFATSSSIEYCTRSDCAGWTDLAFGLGQIGPIVSDGDAVYWTESITGAPPSTRLARCHESGCGIEGNTGETMTMQIGLSSSLGFLSIDRGELYWAGTDQASPPMVHVMTCPVSGCGSPVEFTLESDVTPVLVKDGVLYGTKSVPFGHAVVACPADPSQPSPGAGCITPTTIVQGLDVQAFAIDGTTLFVDALSPGQIGHTMWACALPCTGGTFKIYENSSTDFAVSGGILYGEASLPDGEARLGACGEHACSSGPQPLDMPFTTTVLPRTSFAPDGAGAYAFAGLWPGKGNIGLPLGEVAAIVYIPAPSP